MSPPRGTRANIHNSTYALRPPIFLQTSVIGLHFCRWWYGSIFIPLFAVGSKTHLSSHRVRIGRSRLSKVDDFGTNRKHIMRIPISPSFEPSSYLAPFLRYGNLLAENCVFSYPTPLSFGAPAPYVPFGISR